MITAQERCELLPVAPERVQYFDSHPRTLYLRKMGVPGPEYAKDYRSRMAGEDALPEARDQVHSALTNGELHPALAAYFRVMESDDPANHPDRKDIRGFVEGNGFSIAGYYEAAALQTLMWCAYQKDASLGFERIYGTSGGAGIALYLSQDRMLLRSILDPMIIAHQPLLARYHHQNFRLGRLILDDNYIPDPLKTVLDLDYFRYFMSSEEQLAVPGLKPGTTKMTVVATSAEPGLPATVEARRKYYSNFTDIQDVLGAVQSSCTLPYICRVKDFPYRGIENADGVFTEQIPVWGAAFGHIDEKGEKVEGGKYNIGFSSSNGHSDLGTAERIVAGKVMRENRELGELWLTRMERTKKEKEFIKGKQSANDGPPYVTVFQPNMGTFSLEGRRRILNQAGIKAAKKFFAEVGIKNPETVHQLLMKMWDTKDPKDLRLKEEFSHLDCFAIYGMKDSKDMDYSEYKLTGILD